MGASNPATNAAACDCAVTSMRILHILDHSLPLHSGYSFRTLAILREQRALGWQTIQLTTPRHGDSAGDVETFNGWTFHRTRPSENGPLQSQGTASYLQEMIATARRIDELVEEFRPHVLHAHSPILTAIPALWVGRRRRLPVVYEMRASWEDAAVDHGSARTSSIRYLLSRSLETFVLRRSDAVTTICEGLRTEILARGIDPCRVTVIPNAVDTNAFRFDQAPDAALRQRLGLEGKTVIGFAGSFYRYEGLDLLLDASAALASTHPDLRVLLIGGGPQEESLKQLALQRGLAERVLFLGRVPQTEISSYYSVIDVFAFPRRSMRLTEIVTPLKPLEAMAHGRIVVASDVGGHRELVRDRVTGYLFRADDASALAQTIEKVLAERADWASMRTRARAYVESERTWARSVSYYLPVYSSVSATGPQTVSVATPTG
jgi:PEP-CTERM/exosortase A-associated glycosyltransferase